MLEGLFEYLDKNTTPAPSAVPPVPPHKIQREPLQPTNGGAVPQVPPIPPVKTKSEKKSIFSTIADEELQQNIREKIEERAAIMEHEGGLSRHEAEQAAASSIRVYLYRVKDKPKSKLIAIMPGTELAEAREALALKYGDRLLAVYESSTIPG